MSSTNRQPDLFGAPQGDLFDGVATSTPLEHRMRDLVRSRLQGLLLEAQTALRMPWDAQRADVNAIIFHNMASWLPPEEREVLRAAFRRELDRLNDRG